MKINKKILLASILVTNLVAAQEYYTCVPKKDWWLDVVREGSKKWKKIIHLTPQSKQEEFQQTLQPGKYRVTAAGGGGKPETKEFTLTTASEFKACAGEKGKDPVGDTGGEGGGGRGYLGDYEMHIKTMYMLEEPGIHGFCDLIGGNSVRCGRGCHRGLEGNNTATEKVYTLDGAVHTVKTVSGGGGGGGSYFKVGDIKIIFDGGYGESGTTKKYGKGAGPDGYIIIERLE